MRPPVRSLSTRAWAKDHRKYQSPVPCRSTCSRSASASGISSIAALLRFARSTPSSRTTYTSTSERLGAMSPRAAEPLRTSPRMDGSSRSTSSSRAALASSFSTTATVRSAEWRRHRFQQCEIASTDPALATPVVSVWSPAWKVNAAPRGTRIVRTFETLPGWSRPVRRGPTTTFSPLSTSALPRTASVAREASTRKRAFHGPCFVVGTLQACSFARWSLTTVVQSVPRASAEAAGIPSPSARTAAAAARRVVVTGRRYAVRAGLRSSSPDLRSARSAVVRPVDARASAAPRRRRHSPGATVRAVARHRVLVSAHRCGYAELSAAGASDRTLENTVAGITHAAEVGADYVEFDVRRCSDGVFVISHDPQIEAPDEHLTIRQLSWAELHEQSPAVLQLSEFLTALGPTGVGAHVDMKFATPQHERDAGHLWEIELLEILVAYLDPGRIIMTTGNGAASEAMRDWIAARDLPILVGLSIGASLRGLPWREAAKSLLGQLFPRQRFEASHADAVAAHYALAMARLSRWTARIGVPLLVWTVDSTRLQKRLLRDHRVWMITTNWPARAIALRDGGRR